MYMVMFVLDDSTLLDEVLDAWYNAGITGATIFESNGIFRQRAKRFNLPVRYSLPHVTARIEANYTLMAIVPDEETVQACLKASEKVVGDLDQPYTGVFASWPLAFVKGVRIEKKSPSAGE
jgi:nitrogen regulatory protein PII